MPKPRICASIASTTLDGALRAIDLLKSHKPDLVELRLDYMGEMGGLDKVREASPYPLIATCRRKDQGGLYRGSEGDRMGILRYACDEGFEYIDVEVSTPRVEEIIKELRGWGVNIILSHHDFEGTPPRETMMHVLKRGLSLRPEILKIVGTARRYEDNYHYLRLVLECRDLNLVSFGMGRQGIPSRVLSPLMGGSFTYASAVEGAWCAPGQISIAALREIYRLMGVSNG